MTTTTNDIYTSVISDIKSYSGDDPLLPWLRGVRNLRDSLPPQLLKDKLPRFLQKCARTFDSDRRYRHDLRYLRIWLSLMDYVNDPKAVLKTMEAKKIGTKRSLFYQAYALYYEKMKKFDAADKMYRLGVQNLAEPLEELQKSYEKFIARVERHKNKRIQQREKKSARIPLSDRSSTNPKRSEKNDKNSTKVDEMYGESLLKEASHSMFGEPIEPVNAVSRSSRSQPKVEQSTESGFEIFVDENSNSNGGKYRQQDKEKHKTLEIFIDDELSNDSEPSDIQTPMDGSPSSSGVQPFVFLRPNDHHSESSGDMKVEKSSKNTRTKFREDTVVRRFVGAAILDEPEVEDICHHGLVDPTVNLKEAKQDINDLFSKPIDFVRTTRRKRQEKAAVSGKNDQGAFLILPDDEFDGQDVKKSSQNSSIEIKDELYEPTVCTKAAMDELNNLFSMPLDF